MARVDLRGIRGEPEEGGIEVRHVRQEGSTPAGARACATLTRCLCYCFPLAPQQLPELAGRSHAARQAHPHSDDRYGLCHRRWTGRYRAGDAQWPYDTRRRQPLRARLYRRTRVGQACRYVQVKALLQRVRQAHRSQGAQPELAKRDAWVQLLGRLCRRTLIEQYRP